MSAEALATHLELPAGRGHMPEDACTGAAGGAACGDLVRVSLGVDQDSPEGLIVDAGFDASGCGAALAAGSAVVALVRGLPLLDAARLGADRIAQELGGLSPAKRHAAELAADALHRALGRAARRRSRLEPVAGRTLVAMSGGVDSAVAALLVCEEGVSAPAGVRAGQGAGVDREAHPGQRARPPVVAVTLELWASPENDGERSCCSAQAVRHARQVAHDMGLPHLSIDLREEFRAGVVDGWLADHAAGLTPNPCVRCNGRVRLDAMLELAGHLGAGALATGHYARVRHDPDGGPPLLRVAADESKDQSYALAALSPASLARIRFPLGDLNKAQVRERAASAGLAVARRPDSQDLCFLAGTARDAFLVRHGGIEPRPGAILDTEGRMLGRHRGLHTVTVGQRRGLGLAQRPGPGLAQDPRPGPSGGGPLFVIDTDPAANTVTVGPRERLRTDTVAVRDLTLHRDGACVDAVKIRYRGRRVPCRLEDDDRGGGLRIGAHARARVRLIQEIERTAPGQIACLYAGDAIVGYGTIAG